jgi:hypothetical protein
MSNTQYASGAAFFRDIEALSKSQIFNFDLFGLPKDE